jgi:hypothetical protein
MKSQKLLTMMILRQCCGGLNRRGRSGAAPAR